MKTNEAGVSLIKQFEGLVDGDPKTPGLDPYICPTGYVTVGYGHVLKDSNGQMLRGREGLARAKQIHKSISPEDADDLLHTDLISFEADVRRLTQGVSLNENQFAALVSFTFNLGAGAFQRSTLRRHLLEGRFDLAADEFPKWVKGDTNGDGVRETLPGLVRRREAERQLFLREVKPLTRSRTIAGAAGAATATTASVIAEVSDELARADAAVSATGTEIDILKFVLAGLAIAGALFAIYARVDDRMRKGH
jgi:lysozyme